MSQPCIWYVKEETIVAACLTCGKEHDLKGWYWAGDVRGYGDYDLECSICQEIIHKKEENENKTSV
ncbi:MAG: hypothetical protein DWQ19_12045 [Crenarchaeota archaeon]|nr:MAG: hypothetical protein DWQ19_12045 [Thermoproteota archaeon]